MTEKEKAWSAVATKGIETDFSPSITLQVARSNLTGTAFTAIRETQTIMHDKSHVVVKST